MSCSDANCLNCKAQSGTTTTDVCMECKNDFDLKEGKCVSKFENCSEGAILN